MKKAYKSIVSILLCAVLVFSCSAVAFSADDGCDCGKTPVVFVNGLGGTIFSTDENGEEYPLYPLETDVIVKEVITFLPFGIVAGIFGGWDSFSQALDTMLCKLFADFACDNEGNSILPAHADECDYVTIEEHHGDNEFDFLYDWRLDPYVIAAQLDEYINDIIEVTGHDKVIINGFSEGGEVSLAYLDAYGSDKVEMYISQCSAYQGLTLIGALFTKTSSVDADQLYKFLMTMLPTTNVDSSVLTLLTVLKYTGIYNVLEKLANYIVDNCFDIVFEGFVTDLFACMPGVFCFTPEEYYDDAIKTAFGDDPQYAKLIEKLDRYHNAQVNAEQILKNAQENGMAVAVVSHYGVQPIPLVGELSFQTDGLIDARHSSGGATFAPFDKPFDSSYKQLIDDGHNHISPDGAVDASTCMFPESTWFVSGQTHWNNTDNLIEWLESYDGQPTVYDNPDFPQFLVWDSAQGLAKPQ